MIASHLFRQETGHFRYPALLLTVQVTVQSRQKQIPIATA